MRIIKEAYNKVEIEYNREFEWENQRNCGFSFPCDEHGNVTGLSKEGQENYNKCISGSLVWNGHKLCDLGVVKRTIKYHVNATIECDCGEQFVLYDEYMGACSCSKCGQWYNLFGQQLVAPSMWKEGGY